MHRTYSHKLYSTSYVITCATYVCKLFYTTYSHKLYITGYVITYITNHLTMIYKTFTKYKTTSICSLNLNCFPCVKILKQKKLVYQNYTWITWQEKWKKVENT